MFQHRFPLHFYSERNWPKTDLPTVAMLPIFIVFVIFRLSFGMNYKSSLYERPKMLKIVEQGFRNESSIYAIVAMSTNKFEVFPAVSPSRNVDQDCTSSDRISEIVT